MKPLGASIILLAILCGCRPTASQPLLCQVIARPSAYVGQKLTLSGTAQMYQHQSTLKSQECPDHVLALDMVPRSVQHSADQLPDAQFFTKLVTRPQSSVSVTGQIVHTSDQPFPYVLRVESGIFK